SAAARRPASSICTGPGIDWPSCSRSEWRRRWTAMSIDTRIRRGLSEIDSRLPETDVTSADEGITHERPPRSRRQRSAVPRLVAAAAVGALVGGGLIGWLHHSRTPTDTQPAPPMRSVLVEAPVGSPFNPSPGKGLEMLEVSSTDVQHVRRAPDADATYS